MTGRDRLALGSLVAGAMVATAVGAQSPARPARLQVVLESTATLPAAAFEESLRELLGRLSLVVVRPAGADPRATLARVRLEATPGGVLVTVRRAAEEAPFVQRDVPAVGSDAILVETVAYVILGAVEPLVQAGPEPPGGPPASSQVSPGTVDRAPSASAAPSSSALSPAPSAAPVGPPREPEAPLAGVPSGRLGWSVGARGVARHLDRGWSGVGLGAGVAVALPWARRPSLALEGSRLWTLHRALGGISASVDMLSLRALVSMELPGDDRASLGPVVGGGLDRLALAPAAGPPGAHLAPATSRVQPVLTAALAGRVRLAPWIGAAVTVGLDIDAAPRRWVVQTDQARDAFFTPASVRPFVTMGLDGGHPAVAP